MMPNKLLNNCERTGNVGNRPLDNLVQTSEDRDVVVISWKDKSGLFDGLSGWCDRYPVTVLNTKMNLRIAYDSASRTKSDT